MRPQLWSAILEVAVVVHLRQGAPLTDNVILQTFGGLMVSQRGISAHVILVKPVTLFGCSTSSLDSWAKLEEIASLFFSFGALTFRM